jgi:hypothetical protein|tara:strand:+ start:100 stop:762 length:663 start_codon:yes stop_codon:yes gene_type:complete
MIQTSFFPQPEKDKPLEIIPIPNSIYQPRKVEEILPHYDILPDTYIIYPTGGYHLFYGVSNTFPRYQLPIWPFVKRIKYSEVWSSEEKLENIKKGCLRENQKTTQLNTSFIANYLVIGLHLKGQYMKTEYTKIKENGTPSMYQSQRRQSFSIHTLVARAFVPNPDNKKLIMHINDDPTNYLIENLKWGTHGENMKGKIKRTPDTLEQKYLNLVNKGIIKG